MADGLGPLFGWSPPAPSAPKVQPDQAAELARALSENERFIMAFLRARMHGPAAGRLFHGETLLAFVNEKRVAAGKKRCAPDTPRRLVGELETLGQCGVRCVDRSASLYEVIAVAEE